MISVVVPIYNERELIPELCRRLRDALDTAVGGAPWEVILVDDGSRDGSAQVIAAVHARDARFKTVRLSRNFGHQPAVTAGVHHATGDCVVLIDGDLQDPPEVIGDLIAAWRAGAKVVVAERRTRDDAGIRGIGFKLFYPLLRRLTELPNVPNAGIFGLMDRAVVDEFNRLPERNRFIPGLRLWLGFEQSTVHYDRAARVAGQPKQTLAKLIAYAANAIVSFSYRPLRVATWGGFAFSGFGFLTAGAFIVRRLFFNDHAALGFTTLLTMAMLLSGVQLISVGILGEYIGRIYEEVKQRPLYIVQSKLGLAAGANIERSPLRRAA